jgi:hypothetical protein
MDKFAEPNRAALQEFDRKDQALKNSLNDLVEGLEDTESARNNIRASNEVAWELGAFESGRDIHAPISKETLDGLIVRARSDALESKMNSAATLDRILQIEKKLNRIELLAAFGAGAVIALLLGSYF